MESLRSTNSGPTTATRGQARNAKHFAMGLDASKLAIAVAMSTNQLSKSRQMLAMDKCEAGSLHQTHHNVEAAGGSTARMADCLIWSKPAHPSLFSSHGSHHCSRIYTLRCAFPAGKRIILACGCSLQQILRCHESKDEKCPSQVTCTGSGMCTANFALQPD